MRFRRVVQLRASRCRRRRLAVRCCVLFVYAVTVGGEGESFGFPSLSSGESTTHTQTHTNVTHTRKRTGYRFDDNGWRSAAAVTGPGYRCASIPRYPAVPSRSSARRRTDLARDRPPPVPLRSATSPTHLPPADADRSPTRRYRPTNAVCVRAPFFYLRTAAAYVSP